MVEKLPGSVMRYQLQKQLDVKPQDSLTVTRQTLHLDKGTVKIECMGDI